MDVEINLKAIERRHIKPMQKNAGTVLIFLSVLVIALGVMAYVINDVQPAAFEHIFGKVGQARLTAQNEGTKLSGSVQLWGEAGKGLVLPISLASAIMNNAIIILLVGLFLLFNGIMFHLQNWERMKDLFCVEPAIFFFLLFVYYPVIDLVRISFTDMRIISTDPQPFIGFKNYEWLFVKSGWKYFAESLRITATYTFWEIAITLVGGILLALLLNRMTKGFNAMRTIAFMPKYIAVSTSAIVFIWMLNGDYGIVNQVLKIFGIKGPNWLANSDTALTGILFLTGWRVVGYAMMIYLSAMQGIPQDYYEAASIDGADGVHKFRFITLPMLAPTTLFLLVTTFIASMKVFQSVDVMTSGGPNNATNVMVMWIYNLIFRDSRSARGAAVAVVFFLIILICTALTMKYSNKSVSYDS